MFVTTTQETSFNSNDVQRKLSSHGTLKHRILTLETDELFRLLQLQYGARWGILKFEDSLIGYSEEGSPFVYVDDNIDLQVLSQFMFSEWKLQAADIVIPVLDGITDHKPFINHKTTEILKSDIRKAANASEIWFITNGLNAGMPQLIGAAFRDETSLRRADDAWAVQMERAPKKRKRLVLIGLVCDSEIKDINFKSAEDKSPMEVKVSARSRDILSLNSDHTHFIILRAQPVSSSSVNTSGRKCLTNDSNENQFEGLTDSFESATNKFRDRLEEFLHQKTLQQQSASLLTTTMNPISQLPKRPSSWTKDGFPMVCTLVYGTPGTIELLYQKIQQEIPAVILKGTGGAADIIAFAYEEISAKNTNEYKDGYLTAELVRQLVDTYPVLKDNNVKRNEVCDHIISIVKRTDQGRRKLLTFVNVNSATGSLNDFRKSILSALLQSQVAVTGSKANVQFERNLLLLLDWNLPDLASSEIIQRNDDMNYLISTDLFDKAILGRKRESFVDLFLDREFALHHYLKSDKLRSLFNQTKDQEFFATTSLEGILGLTGDEEVPENFVDHGLNVIVKRLTGISYFFNQHEMDCNAMGIYFGDKTDRGVQRQRIIAEEKALRHLIIYAVLMDRPQLAMILWKRSSEPIRMALICYMMFKNLAPYCHASYQRLFIEKQAKVFSDCAVEVLDKSFNEDIQRTFAMLDEKHPDWNDTVIVELAYLAENKNLLAHAACQRWITRQFYGEISPRNLSWGLFKCSDYFKIIASACLIFPMWFWIVPVAQPPPTSKKAETTEFHGKKSISFTDKIKMLWNAPITKFCTSFVAYLLYLSFFTLAVMWPSCGNLLLDCLVWFWTALIVCEDARAVYHKYRFQSSLRFKRALVEITVQIIFLVLFLSIRIIGLWEFGTCQILTARAILGVGLIYYYYRIVYIFLPISSRFGPLMIGLRHMIMHDLLTVLQLFAIFTVASGVAITAVLYPHYPLNLNLFSKAFIFRGLMALFSNEMADLRVQHQSCSINATSEIDREYSCLRLSHGRSFKYDSLHEYSRYGIISPRCNQPSWIAWFLLIQYYYLVKLLLVPLLTAMFTLTAMRVRSASDQVWIYYRFGIVREYAKRPRLPPPFVIISYIDMFISSISRQCIIKLKKYSDKRNNVRRTRLLSSTNNMEGGIDSDLSSATHLVEFVTPSTASNNDDTLPTLEEDRSLLGRLLNCKPCRHVIDCDRDKKQRAIRHRGDGETNLYWKNKANQCYVKRQETDKVQEKLDNIWNSVINGQEDTNILQKSLRQMNERLFSLEKLMIESHAPTEKRRATLHQEDKLLSESQKFIHVLSRDSPYIYTIEARFPVTEKFISWAVSYDLYGPTLITLPKDHICFQDEERTFVEPNLLELSSTEDQASLTSISQPDILYKWNQIVELNLPDGKKMLVDRVTWITNPSEKTPATYSLDTQLLIPLNPMGRTGVRGRGALIRWGPNKVIMVIITRWKRHHNQFVTADGQRILEAMVFKDEITNDWKLPGSNILGVESPYGAFCRSFNKFAFQENSSEHTLPLQEQDMIEYFESFARNDDSIERATGFESHVVYKGYIDDVRNTDNAWVEAEIWNFHYGLDRPFPRLRNDGMIFWKDMTCNLHGFLIQTSILHDIARIHDAYAE